ncbi:unnamed protein product [Amoebophrya sp. A120]|nr:unnamed protein product [Amoebophrya sp. A120]|eukprot:GSA120T00014214001.1
MATTKSSPSSSSTATTAAFLTTTTLAFAATAAYASYYPKKWKKGKKYLLEKISHVAEQGFGVKLVVAAAREGNVATSSSSEEESDSDVIEFENKKNKTGSKRTAEAGGAGDRDGPQNTTSSSSKSAESAEAEHNNDDQESKIHIPDNANQDCVGVDSEQAGKAAGCAGCPNQGACASGEAKKADPAVAQVAEVLKEVKRKILVLSGKGGVGKSTVSCQLSFAFSSAPDKVIVNRNPQEEDHTVEHVEPNADVGLLDIDICGPSLPTMLGLKGHEVHQSNAGWSPVYLNEHLAVMSIGFMLPNEDDAIIWRGPRKNGLIRQFLTDVTWGKLDYLFVDTPPGTSDEHMAIVGYLNDAKITGAVIVTSPQEVALADVRKEVNFCKRTGVEIIGVIENMQGFLGVSSEGVKKMCKDYDLEFLGSIPLDKDVGLAGERGTKIKDPALVVRMGEIVERIKGRVEAIEGVGGAQETAMKATNSMQTEAPAAVAAATTAATS